MLPLSGRSGPAQPTRWRCYSFWSPLRTLYPELRAAQGSRLSEIAMTKIPGIRLTNYPGGRVLVFSTRGTNTVSNTRRSSGLCQVVVFTDGMREPEGEASSIPFELLGGVEYYPPGYAPIQYRGSGQYSSRGEPVGGSPACGVMLLWSTR